MSFDDLAKAMSSGAQNKPSPSGGCKEKSMGTSVIHASFFGLSSHNVVANVWIGMLSGGFNFGHSWGMSSVNNGSPPWTFGFKGGRNDNGLSKVV